MNQNPIKDKFISNAGGLSVFNFGRMGFKLSENDSNGRSDISEDHKRRQGSRSCGRVNYEHTKPNKCCGSHLRRVKDNTCYPCYKRELNNQK